MKVDLNKLKDEKKKSEKKLKQVQEKAERLGRIPDRCNNIVTDQNQEDSSQINATGKTSKNESIVSAIDNQPPGASTKLENTANLNQEDIFEENYIECQICGKIFSFEDALMLHRKSVHSDLSFNCKLCDIKFTSEEENDDLRKNESHKKLSNQIKQEFKK